MLARFREPEFNVHVVRAYPPANARCLRCGLIMYAGQLGRFGP
jgi:hypothetical protein